MDHWDLELVVVRGGSHFDAERRALARDTDRALLTRLRRGVYVRRAAFEALTPEHRHIVRMRAVQAVAPEPVVFSHFSALVLHGLPVMRSRLGPVHTTVPTSESRGRDGVAGHVFQVTSAELTMIGPLTVTTAPRTVVDVAGAASFPEGVMSADALLRSGVPRAEVELAVDVAGARHAGRRMRDVVAFAHPGSDGPNESYSRVAMLRLGIEPPEVQHPLWDEEGFVAWLDFWFPRLRVGGEADGKVKLLDPAMADRGAGMALYREKRREDRVLPLVSGLARWGWRESTNPDLLGRKLAAFGVVPASPRATLAEYVAAAKDARPRPRFVVRP